jgi:hypothetical protein
MSAELTEMAMADNKLMVELLLNHMYRTASTALSDTD